MRVCACDRTGVCACHAIHTYIHSQQQNCKCFSENCCCLCYNVIERSCTLPVCEGRFVLRTCDPGSSGSPVAKGHDTRSFCSLGPLCIRMCLTSRSYRLLVFKAARFFSGGSGGRVMPYPPVSKIKVTISQGSSGSPIAKGARHTYIASTVASICLCVYVVSLSPLPSKHGHGSSLILFPTAGVMTTYKCTY